MELLVPATLIITNVKNSSLLLALTLLLSGIAAIGTNFAIFLAKLGVFSFTGSK